ncbi:MAG: hypothetical protein F4Y69_04000 [Chloroflexi bacterium]|nr:hypothetical protein [Chloroflexota bacterium]MYF21331.1 hypothetical protein [Chloroflexota bacterium]
MPPAFAGAGFRHLPPQSGGRGDRFANAGGRVARRGWGSGRGRRSRCGSNRCRGRTCRRRPN